MKEDKTDNAKQHKTRHALMLVGLPKKKQSDKLMMRTVIVLVRY